MSDVQAAPWHRIRLPIQLGRLHPQDLVLPALLLVLMVTGTIVKPGVFLTRGNLLTVVTQASVVGVIAVGMTFVIATAGIDLSVGSMLAAASIAGGKVMGEGSLVFIGAAIGFGLLLGMVNGAAVTFGRVVPFIATVAMLTVARGIALWMSEKTPIPLTELERVRWFGNGKVAGIPVPVLVFVFAAVAGWVLLNRTRFGRYVIAVGGNRSAARLAGVPVQWTVFAVYALTGLCVGISAVLLSGRLGTSSPIVGNLVELDAIAAVVIGGTSLAGGRATMTGTFFGVLTFALIFNLLNLLNEPTEIQQIARGVIIVGAVAMQRRDS